MKDDELPGILAEADPAGASANHQARSQDRAKEPPPDAADFAQDKAGIIRRLFAIIDAKPEQADGDHPFCEKRIIGAKEHFLFPAKLDAIELLNKMMGWNHTDELKAAKDRSASSYASGEFNESDYDDEEANWKPDRLTRLLEFIRTRE